MVYAVNLNAKTKPKRKRNHKPREASNATIVRAEPSVDELNAAFDKRLIDLMMQCKTLKLEAQINDCIAYAETKGNLRQTVKEAFAIWRKIPMGEEASREAPSVDIPLPPRKGREGPDADRSEKPSARHEKHGADREERRKRHAKLLPVKGKGLRQNKKKREGDEIRVSLPTNRFDGPFAVMKWRDREVLRSPFEVLASMVTTGQSQPHA